MKVHIQVNLLIAAALYLLWALTLFMGQEQAHPILSAGPYDAVTNSMFGASMFAFVILFIIGVLNPIKEIVYASIVALAFLGLVALYQMFLSDGMPRNPATFFSLVITLTIAAILFFSMIQAPVAPGTRRSVAARRVKRTPRKATAMPRAKAARRAPVTKKGVKKKKLKKKVRARRKSR